MRRINKCLKTRDASNPYEIWKAGDWEWKVLKKWQIDDDKPFARWFCAVKSPMNFGSYDYGDVYVSEIKNNAKLVAMSCPDCEGETCLRCGGDGMLDVKNE